MNERRGQIWQEVAANRLEKRLRQGRVHRASLLSALLATVWRRAGSRSERKVPVKVKIYNVKAISAGFMHNLALKENGTVWARGDNYPGQLGNGTSGADTASDIPVSVKNLSNVRSVDGGDGFTLAATR